MNKRYMLGEVKDTSDNAETFPGTFEVVLSTPDVDRDGESIEAKAFEPLPDFMSFDIDHGMSVATTVGSGTPRYDGDQLKVSGTWSSTPLAQQTRTLVREKHVRYTSVAFMGAKYETKDGVPTITKAEILNGAFTPVPSNRSAVILDAKSFADEKVPGFRPLFKGHGMAASELSAAISKAIEDVHGGERVYTSLRDYTDDEAIFYVYSYQTGDRLLKQSYSVSGNKATLTGDPVEVVAKVVYEELQTDDGKTAPKPGSAGTADTKSAVPADDSASALAMAQAALAEAETALALVD